MARKKLAGYQKAGLWIIALFIAWQFLKLPEVIESILTFFLAGVVPGTNIVLSPNAVMSISGAAAGLVILLFALRALIGSNRVEHHEVTVFADEPSAQPEPSIEPAEAFKQSAPKEHKQPAKQSPSVLAKKLQSAKHAVTDTAAPRAILATIKAWYWLQPRLIRAYYIAKVYTIRLLRWCKRELHRFWKWLLPQLKRFDAWLEVQVRHIEKRAKRKAQTSEAMATLADAAQEVKRSVAKLDAGAKLSKATTKAKPYVRKAHKTTKKTVRKARTAIRKAHK